MAFHETVGYGSAGRHCCRGGAHQQGHEAGLARRGQEQRGDGSHAGDECADGADAERQCGGCHSLIVFVAETQLFCWEASAVPLLRGTNRLIIKSVACSRGTYALLLVAAWLQGEMTTIYVLSRAGHHRRNPAHRRAAGGVRAPQRAARQGFRRPISAAGAAA